MGSSIPPDERLLDLVIALVNTTTRLTKEQVRRTVAGYKDAPNPEAFERMFERDKDTLRELGVPVLTVTDAGHGDDIGYRIDHDAYTLPPVELTGAELGVLALAAQIWQDASLRADSNRALTKLRSTTPAAGADDLAAAFALRVDAGGAALRPLLDAVQHRRVATFTYRAATTGEVRRRTVHPWRLVARRGGWMLVGFDTDRQAGRSFRLSRIEGTVRVVGEPHAFAPATSAQVAQVDAQWHDAGEQVAELAVLPDRAEALRARAITTGEQRHGRDILTLSYRATWELAEEIVRYGDAVVVLNPPQARQAVIDLLQAAAALPDRCGRPETSSTKSPAENQVDHG